MTILHLIKYNIKNWHHDEVWETIPEEIKHEWSVRSDELIEKSNYTIAAGNELMKTILLEYEGPL